MISNNDCEKDLVFCAHNQFGMILCLHSDLRSPLIVHEALYARDLNVGQPSASNASHDTKGAIPVAPRGRAAMLPVQSGASRMPDK